MCIGTTTCVLCVLTTDALLLLLLLLSEASCRNVSSRFLHSKVQALILGINNFSQYCILLLSDFIVQTTALFCCNMQLLVC